MEPLALSTFEIKGFRAFDHLKLAKLGRVTLFVGKNNVGKTSLLEALWVYANQGSPSILWSLLVERNEGGSLNDSRSVNAPNNWEEQVTSLRYLFHGRMDTKVGQGKIELGPIENPAQKVIVKFILIERIVDEEGNRRNREVEQPVDGMETTRGLLIQSGKVNSIFPFTRSFPRAIQEQLSIQTEWPCVFLPANGLSGDEVEKYWDSVTLSPLENDVLDTVKIIEPEIERINLIGTQATSRIYREDRIPIVKIRSVDSPFPLKSLGEGMNRIFGLALAMVNAKDGMLLIDEIESGLHYSILPEMWRFIFQAAQRLNVQVFATTHSWDCITGFQQAAQESDQVGMMIRLVNKKGKIVPTFFDEKDLSIATREKIEVR